jgi:anion-transporting  ArsA/GET3 family ATPase
VTAALANKRLVIVTGKGGVGKTTVAAALALDFARAGLRTLVCEVNAKERIAPLLGRGEVGAKVTSLEENLWAVNVQPYEAMREYALMIVKFESIYNAVFENRLVRYFLRFIPSLQELVLLGKILFHVKEQRPDKSWRFDRVIVDAPATGHAITFLSVPQVLLNTVPPGALANDARWMRDFLVDEKVTAVVLVSLPEEMPVNETFELHAALRDQVKVTSSAVVLNNFVGPRFTDAEVATMTPGTAAHIFVSGHRVREHLSASAFARLQGLGLPVQCLPRVHSNAFDRSAIEQLADQLKPLREGT